MDFRKVFSSVLNCVKSVQIRSYSWSLFSCIRTKYGAQITPYLETFHAVSRSAYYFFCMNRFTSVP